MFVDLNYLNNFLPKNVNTFNPQKVILIDCERGYIVKFDGCKMSAVTEMTWYTGEDASYTINLSGVGQASFVHYEDPLNNITDDDINSLIKQELNNGRHI